MLEWGKIYGVGGDGKMHEIKFRFWDEDNLEMLSWEDIQRLDADGIYPFLNMVRDFRGNVMQFTGLTDVYGREIYEGDIVRGDRWDHVIGQFFTEIFVVGWGMGCWVYKGNSEFQVGLLANLKDVEVLGNIFENPDLLKLVGKEWGE